MKLACVKTKIPASVLSLAAVTSALAIGSTAPAAGQDIPRMTVKIFNNDPNHNIYPVYSTGISSPRPDLWLQAWFKVPKDRLDKDTYVKANQFRFYINPEGTAGNPGGGIPPGGNVVFTVPLLTQLVRTRDLDPSQPDQYIDWWGGGRIEIFMAPVADKKPPVALTKLYKCNGCADWKTQTEIDVSTLPGRPTLPRCVNCEPELKFFKDSAGLGTNEPSQLIEFTLGAAPIIGGVPVLQENNVDIDVSYVDAAFMPAAITPFNPDLPKIAQVGYVGSVMKIDNFQCRLTRFLGLSDDPQDSCFVRNPPGKGWPQFIDRQKNTVLKVPSLVNLFGRDLKQPQTDLTPMKPAPNNPWPPLAKMRTLWDKCIAGTDARSICKNIVTVRTMFQANYQNYFDNYKTKFKTKCDQNKDPIVLTEDLMIGHVYGFTPFTENCTPETNLLADTPGYRADNSRRFQQVKDIFDDLMYWPTGEFAPYVGMVHNAPYLNIPNVYAYSVDDAMGNLQVEGKGMIIAVGGVRGLPNPNPASPPVTVGIGFGKKDKIKFTHYGICTLAPNRAINPDFPAFDVSITADNLTQCPISLKEDAHPNVIYVIKLKSEPPFTFEFDPNNPITPKTRAPIDCSGNSNQLAVDWCQNVYAYSEHPPEAGRGTGKHHVITPAPQQPPP